MKSKNGTMLKPDTPLSNNAKHTCKHTFWPKKKIDLLQFTQVGVSFGASPEHTKIPGAKLKKKSTFTFVTSFSFPGYADHCKKEGKREQTTFYGVFLKLHKYQVMEGGLFDRSGHGTVQVVDIAVSKLYRKAILLL